MRKYEKRSKSPASWIRLCGMAVMICGSACVPGKTITVPAPESLPNKQYEYGRLIADDIHTEALIKRDGRLVHAKGYIPKYAPVPFIVTP